MAYEEIDKLYEDMLSRVPYNQLKQIERNPAGAMSPAAAISPGRVLKQNNPGQIIDKTLGGMFPMANSPQEAPPQDTPFANSQLQPLTTINAPPFIDPIEPTFQDPNKRKPEYIENYRGNVNRNIEEGREDVATYVQKQKEAESTYDVSRDKLLGVIDQMGLAQEPFKSEYDYDAKIKQLQNMQDLEPSPQLNQKEDPTAEIIRALGAPLLGAMTGEAGAIAQRPAQIEITRQGEKLKKDMADRDKSMLEKKIKLSDEISKRMVAIRQLKEGEYESYDKDRKAQLDQLKLMKDSVEKLTDKDQDKLKAIADTLAKTDERVYKTTMEGSKEVAKMEETQAGRDAAMERLKLQEEGLKKRAILGAKTKAIKAGTTAGPEDYIPGYKWNQKTPINKADISKMQKAVGDKETIINNLKQVKDLVNKASQSDLANPYSEARGQIDSILADAQLKYKGPGFAELGVLTGPDVKFLEKILEPPNALKMIGKGGKEALLSRYQTAADRINSTVDNVLTMRGFKKAAGAAPSPVKSQVPIKSQAPIQTQKTKLDPSVRQKMINELKAKGYK